MILKCMAGRTLFFWLPLALTIKVVILDGTLNYTPKEESSISFSSMSGASEHARLSATAIQAE